MTSPGAFISTSKSTSTASAPAGNVDVEGIQIDRIAAPIQCRPVRGDAQRREVVERTRRTVLAGNPLRIDERQSSPASAGMRSCTRMIPSAARDASSTRIAGRCSVAYDGCATKVPADAASGASKAQTDQECAQSWHDDGVLSDD